MNRTETPKPTATYEISSDGSIWIQSRFKIVNREDIPWKDVGPGRVPLPVYGEWNGYSLKKYIILDTSTGKIRGTSDSHEWCFRKICMVEEKAKKGGKL